MRRDDGDGEVGMRGIRIEVVKYYFHVEKESRRRRQC